MSSKTYWKIPEKVLQLYKVKKQLLCYKSRLDSKAAVNTVINNQ